MTRCRPGLSSSKVPSFLLGTPVSRVFLCHFHWMYCEALMVPWSFILILEWLLTNWKTADPRVRKFIWILKNYPKWKWSGSHWVMSDSLGSHGLYPLFVEFSRQEYWSGLPFPSPGDLPNPGMELWVSCIAGRFFTIWATREVPGHS